MHDINHSITDTRTVSISEYERRLHDLNERVKELKCLYGISKLVERNNVPLDDILQNIAGHIPESWQYPEITCARITLDYREFRSQRFRETQWRQACDIFVDGENRGIIEVFYLERRPDSDEGPFMKEERNLLNVIAERLGNIVSHKNAGQRLMDMQKELALKAQRLEESNTALKVLLDHQESERLKLEGDILQRLKVLVFPYIDRLKTGTNDETQKVYIKVIERNLQEITKQFTPPADDLITTLSPLERQVANLVRENHSTKDIARLLTMSENTVFFYRKCIRRKLHLQGQQINLKTHLQSLYKHQ